MLDFVNAINASSFLHIDFFIAVIVLISGTLAIGSIVRKFPAVGAIDLEKVPQEKDRQKRYSILENRLRRELTGRSRVFLVSFKVIQDRFGGLWSSLVKKVTQLEERYEEQIKRTWKSQFSKEERESQVRMMLQNAANLYDREQYQDAEKKYIEVVSLNPKNIDAYKGLGQVYVALKEYDHAKEVLKQVIKLNKKDDDAYARLATVETSLGNFDEAQAFLQESVTLNANLAAHHIDLGKVYTAKGNLSKAIEQYQEAVRLEPANPKNLSLVFETALEMKNRTLAQQTLEALKIANPENQKIGDYQVEVNNIEEQKNESLPK